MLELSELQKQFGAFLKEKRKAGSLSQEKMAELCDLEVSFISRMERGVNQPSLYTIFRIAEALGISVAELFGEFEEHVADKL